MHHQAALAALRARRDRLLELIHVAHARHERSRALVEQGKVLADELEAVRRPSPRSGPRTRPGPQMA
jgi:hypothetical protein